MTITKTMPDIIIAIDGYSSTGKSSFAKLIAAKLDYLYLDSGALYRGVTLFAVENGLIDEECNISLEELETELRTLDLHFENINNASCLFMGERCIENEIRSLAISSKVSPVSAVPFVRSYVDGILRAAGRKRRIVMDGRDIGTTVFPDAELKIFMTADPLVRAERRAAEMRAKGHEVKTEDVLENLLERDRIDSSREVSPLTQAPDAIVLDNSHMTFEQQMEWVLNIIENKICSK